MNQALHEQTSASANQRAELEAIAHSQQLVRLHPNEEQWRQMHVSMAIAGGMTSDEALALTESLPPADPPDGLDGSTQ
jgi:hypothetical protein